MPNTLKSIATSIMLTASALMGQQQASAQQLKNAFRVPDEIERKHRTPESQAQYEQFFYKKDTLELPDSLSFKEYVQWFKENEERILKFFDYADSILVNMPQGLKQKDEIVELYYNDLDPLNARFDISYSLKNGIAMVDSAYFDGGNGDIVNSYENFLGSDPEYAAGFFDQFSIDVKQKNNVSFFHTDSKVFFVQGVSFVIRKTPQSAQGEIVYTKDEDWRQIGQKGDTDVLKNCAFVNPSIERRDYVANLSREYMKVFDEVIKQENFWLGAIAQEISYLRFPHLTELGSDMITAASNPEGGKLVFLLRLKNFYDTVKYGLTIKEGMGSAYYEDIYLDMEKRVYDLPGGLDGIKESQDRESRSQANKKELKKMRDIYLRDAQKFIEKN